MMVTSSVILALALVIASAVSAQSVPESMHSDVQGPSEMCGLVGRDAQDLMRQVRSSPTVTQQNLNSNRFEAYANDNGFMQWVLTKPAEPAYPAVTCRHAYQDKDGSWQQTRNMRCDASRAACDKLFIEFQNLDEQMRQEIARRVSPKI